MCLKWLELSQPSGASGEGGTCSLIWQEVEAWLESRTVCTVYGVYGLQRSEIDIYGLS